MRKVIFFSCLFFLNTSCFALDEIGHFADEVHQYTLPNGLNLLVRVDKRAPVVMSQVWYQVGSSNERLGETGISHFVEHMMFKGTTNFPPGELTRLIATNGGVANAYTFQDATVYSNFMPKDQLPLIFQLESDRMENLNFDAGEFESERQVILEERRLKVEDDPMGYMFQTLEYVSNMASPYENPIIGWKGDIEQLSVNEIEDWYERYYAANLATIVVVGDVDPATVNNLAEQYFGNLKRALPVEQKDYPILSQTGVKHILIKRPGGVPVLMMSFRVPSISSSQNQPIGFDLIVLKDLLAEMNSSVLQEHLVRDQGLASYIGVSYNPWARYNTTFTLMARPMPGVSLGQIEGAIFDEIEALKENPPTDDQLNRIKKYAKSQYLYGLDDLSGQANLLGRVENVGLPWQLSSDYPVDIDAVTNNDLISGLSLYFNENNLVDAELVLLPSKIQMSAELGHTELSHAEGVLA